MLHSSSAHLETAPMRRSRYVLTEHSRHPIPAAVDDVWARIAEPERFDEWWGWLREFEVLGEGMTDGSVLRGRVVPPVPYSFAVDIHIVEVVPARHVRAKLSGDLAGQARIGVEPAQHGCAITVAWQLEMRTSALRAAAHVARPVIVWGHDQVVASTVRRFREVVREEARNGRR